jgi:hypothetical protein
LRLTILQKTRSNLRTAVILRLDDPIETQTREELVIEGTMSKTMPLPQVQVF